MNFGLYQTFVSTGLDKKFPAKKKDELLSLISSADQEQCEAIFMLICEHSRIHEGFSYDSPLPYNIKSDENNITVSLNDLDDKLLWILYRFCTLISQ